jgi:predicted RNA-binding Zn ribbon-like protein
MSRAPEKQPGGREPAPGDLALVQAFVNSNYSLEEHDRGAELLDSPQGLERWFRKRDLDGTRVDLEEALAVREGLRALLVAKRSDEPDRHAIDTLNAIAGSRGVSVQLGLDGPSFESPGDPLALILALAAKSMLDGTWARLKACKECCWAFYDHSKNGAGSWCSMKVCGGRVKQRAYYERVTRPAQRPTA